MRNIHRFQYIVHQLFYSSWSSIFFIFFLLYTISLNAITISDTNTEIIEHESMILTVKVIQISSTSGKSQLITIIDVQRKPFQNDFIRKIKETLQQIATRSVGNQLIEEIILQGNNDLIILNASL